MIAFGVKIRVWRINVRTILGRIMIINTYIRNIFIQNFISKLITMNNINSWDFLLWHDRKKRKLLTFETKSKRRSYIITLNHI